MRTLLRTPGMWERYENSKVNPVCFMCVKPNFYGHMKCWSIVKNDFPYDAIADSHLLLVLNRHADKPSSTEWLEILKHLGYFKFDTLQWNAPSNQSIKGHFHLHLMNWKRV